ncbi:hypothetical protein ACIOUE_23365 [Streptomyces xanthochromogenes]|uniref:hypothetical protein n=1 Tax=Streptomyces xanthochromogenes TaxID=67384 RepID=UPI00381AD588
MATILRHPRPGFTWNWWAVDTKGFLVQFNGGAAPEHLLTHGDRVDAAASWGVGIGNPALGHPQTERTISRAG